MTGYSSFLLFICLFMALAGCSVPPEQTAVTGTVAPTSEREMAAVPTATATTVPAPLPTFTAAPTATPTNEPTAVPTLEASNEAETAVMPRLIIANPNGIFAAAADGSGVKQLVDSPLTLGNEVYGYQTAFSPDGRFLAYTSPPGEPTSLHLLDINSGVTQLITPLFSNQTEVRPEDDCLGADNDSNRCQAAFTVGKVAWSPDSQKLAFVSAHAGDSADVYVYTAADQQISQLSAGPTAASRLNWSPDSQTIFHYGVKFYSGAGSESVLSGWAVRADGADMIKLHDELHSQHEIIVGWQDAETIVIYSMDVGFCGIDLRAHNVRTGSTTPLWDGLFAQDGVAMQPDGTLLIETTCPPEDGRLLYVRTHPAGEIIPIPDVQPDLPIAPRWSAELNAFYSRHVNGWQLFSTEGQVVTYRDLGVDWPETVPPDALRGAQHWAWVGPDGGGVWVQANTPGSSPDRIFNERADHLLWNPSGDTLFFLSGKNPVVLYAAQAPAFALTAVTANELDGYYWDVLMAWSQSQRN